MKKLNVVVTAGGTREKIDDVRVMTNISTGKLGAKIADIFATHGHDVTYVAPESAVKPQGTYSYSYIKVTDTASVMDEMIFLVPKADVVIMSMAVSDFTFEYKGAVKVSSDSSDALIEHMRNCIQKTPKVISNFRKWNKKAILVGFKFTSGKSSKELKDIANKLMEDNKLDMVFANDKKAIEKSGEHVGVLLMKDWEESLRSKDEIAQSIYDNVIRLAQDK